MEKPIIDICCGSRMFWFDKNNPAAVFMDNRQLTDTLCDGRTLEIKPDVLADFRAIPYPDESFYMVVFDPPHLKNAGKNSWLGKKYGILQPTWREDIKQGFAEGMRVLKPFGSLIFKWNEEQIKLKEIMPLFKPAAAVWAQIQQNPLFGFYENYELRGKLWQYLIHYQTKKRKPFLINILAKKACFQTCLTG